MKLCYSPTSPYVRKVMVTAIEKGLDSQIEKLTVAASPVKPDPTLSSKKPAGQVLGLITAEHAEGVHMGWDVGINQIVKIAERLKRERNA